MVSGDTRAHRGLHLVHPPLHRLRCRATADPRIASLMVQTSSLPLHRPVAAGRSTKEMCLGPHHLTSCNIISSSTPQADADRHTSKGRVRSHHPTPSSPSPRWEHVHLQRLPCPRLHHHQGQRVAADGALKISRNCNVLVGSHE